MLTKEQLEALKRGEVLEFQFTNLFDFKRTQWRAPTPPQEVTIDTTYEDVTPKQICENLTVPKNNEL